MYFTMSIADMFRRSQGDTKQKSLIFSEKPLDKNKYA
jgi:hypothetical protein